MTGDWGGFRDAAAKHGVTLDVNWLQTLQGVVSGKLPDIEEVR